MKNGKRFAFVSAAIFLISILATACTAKWVELKSPYTEKPAKVDGDAFFGYKKAPIEARESLIESRADYDLVRVSFPSYFQDDAANRLVTAYYFRQKTNKPTPSIIMLPILGGDYDVTLGIADFFAARGFNVLHFERKSGLFESPEKGLARAREVMIASVVDQRRGIDWWLTRPEVDARRLGVCGVSMGGFQASLLMAVDRRVKAGAFLLNGGNIPELLFVSREPSVVDYVKDLEKRTGLTRDQLREDARKQLADIDPVVFAPNLDPARVLTISGRFDWVVPMALSTQWWEAAGRPNRIILPTGHYSAVFAVHYALQACLDHFNKVFGLEN